MEKEVKAKDREIVVGLDIGTTKIAVIIGAKNEFNKLDIFGYSKVDSIGVRRGEILNILETTESIKRAIELAGKERNVDIKIVNVGIAGQHIGSIQHKASTIRSTPNEPITQEDIDSFIQSIYNLAMNPGEKIIDVIPQEYTIDEYQNIKQPVGVLGHQITGSFHIVTAKVAAAQNIIRCVNNANNIIVKHTFLQPIASAFSVLTAQEKEAGVVLVDIGGGTTDIAVYLNGIIRHTAVIPFGGDIITEDIKRGCKLIQETAEELKIKYGSAIADEIKDEVIISIPGISGRNEIEISQKNLSKIINARISEIIRAINDEIINTEIQDKLSAGIVLTGGGSLLTNIAQLTQFITGMDVRLGRPNEHLSSDTDKEISNPMYSTAVGLILLGIERDEKQNRILNESAEQDEDDENEETKTKKKVKKSKFSSTISDSFLRFLRDGIDA